MHTESADRLSLVIERLVRSLRALTANDPLSQAASSVLSRLDTSGPSGVTALARAERVTQPAMTQLISRMHADGLVMREASASDRRSTVITPTATGLAALHRRRERRAARVSEALTALTAAEREQLEQALPALERLAEITHRSPEAIMGMPAVEPSE